MQNCPKGAIVNFSELTRLQAALEDAIELVEMDEQSLTVRKPRWRTAEDREQMKARRTKLSQYRSLRERVRRARLEDPR